MVEHHNFCHNILKSFLFFSNLIGLIEISYYAVSLSDSLRLIGNISSTL